jgi:hypothetical protein
MVQCTTQDDAMFQFETPDPGVGGMVPDLPTSWDRKYRLQHGLGRKGRRDLGSLTPNTNNRLTFWISVASSPRIVPLRSQLPGLSHDGVYWVRRIFLSCDIELHPGWTGRLKSLYSLHRWLLFSSRSFCAFGYAASSPQMPETPGLFHPLACRI